MKMSLFRAFDDIREQIWCEIFRIDVDDEYNDMHMNSTVGNAKSALKKTQSLDVHGVSPSDSERAATNVDNYILQLPTELQFMILQHLTFGEVESLRRTCRPMRTRIDKSFIREIFPTIKFDLLSTCFRCLRYDPIRNHLIHADESDARYPLASECLDCVSWRGGFVVGRTYTLGTFATVCVCRYCGFPVTNDAAWKEYEFHRACYQRYRIILLYYFLVGCVQCVIAIVAAALCWRYFKGYRHVIVPSIVSVWSMQACNILTLEDQLPNGMLGVLLECVTGHGVEDLSLVFTPRTKYSRTLDSALDYHSRYNGTKAQRFWKSRDRNSILYSL
ncbi:hypothetical protein FHETE_10315 [Fusarium heterosporum]|uniref:F-box domain-containing protein n=1 Tax=Fusarium heterosporum TaxID=42747 RepID=A0A8H5SPX5_FUSHE|nr:hypothetical protein FHETE_10315 [Fusarium heterosporum]